eukprot:TRINITY_DN15005_c0_g1_i1.p1 TRINITY_DN15005_c0_g1~~TRINITY_DN15005_c0_g1_i1.p1  ORF type:complete len:257 (-),score=39.57 TRINITY_DN15005_c0_g1_i1:96-866(-)
MAPDHQSSSSSSVEAFFHDQLMPPGAVRTVRRDRNNSNIQVRSWYLAWCHERCFKPEAADMRKMLADMAEAGDATLVCFKKAAKFLEWLAHQRTSPYVLVADWRETKPCWDGLEPYRAAGQGRPLGFCIFAETPQVYQRALEWVKHMPPSCLSVLSELSTASLKAFLSGRCGLTIQDVHEVAHGSTAALSPRAQRHPQTGDPRLVHGRVDIEAQAASHEHIMDEVATVKHMSVSEFLNRFQADPANLLKTDIILSL